MASGGRLAGSMAWACQTGVRRVGGRVDGGVALLVWGYKDGSGKVPDAGCHRSRPVERLKGIGEWLGSGSTCVRGGCV